MPDGAAIVSIPEDRAKATFVATDAVGLLDEMHAISPCHAV
jgi:hypothetical protein